MKWKESGTATLNKDVFGVEVNEDLIHRALILQLANARVAIAHTKTRGERRGSTRKIYRQKGTGRARMGSNRSPIRKKGWVAFGPRNDRNFTLAMNRKERQKALFCVLSSKVKAKSLVVVEKLEMKEAKTKTMNTIMQTLPLGKTTLIALAEKNENVERSISNLKTVKYVQSAYLNMADLLKYETLVLTEDSLKQLNALTA
jgi:large subunit ribosomal protein L4